MNDSDLENSPVYIQEETPATDLTPCDGRIPSWVQIREMHTWHPDWRTVRMN